MGRTQADSEGRKVLLLVDDTHRGHVFPATVEAAELLLDEIESLYFYEVDAADNTVAGYGFHGAAKAGATVFESINLWQLALPEPIVAVSCRRWRGRAGVGGQDERCRCWRVEEAIGRAATTEHGAACVGERGEASLEGRNRLSVGVGISTAPVSLPKRPSGAW